MQPAQRARLELTTGKVSWLWARTPGLRPIIPKMCKCVMKEPREKNPSLHPKRNVNDLNSAFIQGNGLKLRLLTRELREAGCGLVGTVGKRKRNCRNYCKKTNSLRHPKKILEGCPQEKRKKKEVFFSTAKLGFWAQGLKAEEIFQDR